MKRDARDDQERIFQEEEPPPRHELPAFVRPLAPIAYALRDWWRELFVLSLAGLAWTVLVVTVIGGPPATAALVTTARASVLHEGPTPRLFIGALRDYFLRSWLLGLLHLVSLLIIVFDFPFYYNFASQGGLPAILMSILLLFVAISWLQTLYYAWAMLVVRSDLGLGQMLRNGGLLSLRYPLHTLLANAFLGLLLYGGFILPPLAVLIIPPIWALLTLHNLYLLAPDLVPEDAHDLSLVESQYKIRT